MSTYNIILSSNESTVVAEYEPQVKRSDSYQSEAALEQAFIKILVEQGYEYVTIHSEDALIDNLRRQLERSNQYTLPTKNGTAFSNIKLLITTTESWKRLVGFKRIMCRISPVRTAQIPSTTLIPPDSVISKKMRLHPKPY